MVRLSFLGREKVSKLKKLQSLQIERTIENFRTNKLREFLIKNLKFQSIWCVTKRHVAQNFMRLHTNIFFDSNFKKAA